MLVIKSPLRSRIAVVELFGVIGSSIKSHSYERVLSHIEKEPRIRALVLDIDSPGGGVADSDYIYRAVGKIAAKKPVVASIRGVGASGSYMIACAAEKIVASPAAIIGSIGVMSVRPVLRELLQRVGVSVTVSKSGDYKDMGAFWRDATVEERDKMQGLIDEAYDGFVSKVAEARGLDDGRVRELATGEVFWAARARDMRLVDELGDLDRAIEIAAELANAPKRPVHMRPRRSLRELLLSPVAESAVRVTFDELERRLWFGAPR